MLWYLTCLHSLGVPLAIKKSISPIPFRVDVKNFFALNIDILNYTIAHLIIRLKARNNWKKTTLWFQFLNYQKSEDISMHSSEMRGLCLMKCSNNILQNLPIFLIQKPMYACSFFYFSFHATIFSLMKWKFFEAFHRNISSSINLLFLKNVHTCSKEFSNRKKNSLIR